jgi:hypothetical protein
MKRPTKATTPPFASIPAELRDLAQRKLRESYREFVGDTSAEDPKHFIARSAAAREALDHLARLEAGATLPEEPVEPTDDELIEDARADLARESGS